MVNLLTLIVAILIFFSVIFVHEFGHFFAAKLTGIAVEEFSIGMGPSLFTSKRNETQYSLRVLPIGGYVSMENVDDSNPDSFNNAPLRNRMIVILAGAFMNFVLAIILFFIISLLAGTPTNTVGEIIEGSPAVGKLEVGDVIVSVNRSVTESWDDVTNQLSESEKHVVIEVLRDGKATLVELNKNEDDIVGIYPARERSVLNSLESSLYSVFMIIGALMNFIISIFTGNFSLDSVSGPVGIVTSINQATNLGLYYVMFFLAYISVNVGFLNLLPIPPLDGSKFLLLLLEGVRGRKISLEAESIINLIGFSIFMLLIIIVTVNDIARLG